MTLDQDVEAGFSTIEMLVAFVIITLSLGVAAQAISQARLALFKADGRYEQMMLVRSIIAEEIPAMLENRGLKSLQVERTSWKAAIQLLPEFGVAQITITLREPTVTYRYLTSLPIEAAK